ncbi:MAG TPA: DUF2231 domain-containing protein [Candidatus Acidoferrum sp.]|nr:DUF2231 domain-containing protein [Candidatus Acidoferrum sp.]
MINPFDPRTALLAKHAQHVALIHFPIALFIVGVIFDALGAWTKRELFASAAFLNLSAAAFTVPFAVFTGILAWQLQLEGERLKGILLYHLLAALVSAVIILASWWVHFRARRGGIGLGAWRFSFEFMGIGMVALTGHLGGFLSGVNF